MNRRLRICFLIPGFGGGGAEKQCALLLNALQSYPELELQLIYFEEGPNFERINLSGLTIQKIRSRSFYDPRNLLKINNLVKQNKPDILFSWLPVADIYARLIKKRHPHIKWIVAERDSAYSSNFRNNLRNKWSQKADLVIANSEAGRLFWIDKGMSDDRVKMIKNILHIQHPVPGKVLKGNPVVLFVGRLTQQKNVLEMTRFFCFAAKELPEAGFYIIGQGNLREEMERIIGEADQSETVKLLGYKKDIETYFAGADIFISLSHHEGTPNTLMESIALDTIPLVSDIPEHREVLGASYPFYLPSEEASGERFLMILNMIIKEGLPDEKKSALKDYVNGFNDNHISGVYMKAFKNLMNK